MLFTILIGNTYAQFKVKNNQLQKIDFANSIVYVQSKELKAQQIEQCKERELISAIEVPYNSKFNLLQEVIKDQWYLQNTYGEISDKEIEKKLKSGEEILYITLYKHTDRFFYKRIHRQTYHFNFSHYVLSLMHNKKEVISIPLVNEELSELDIHFAINTLQSIMAKEGAFNNLCQYSKDINSNAKTISGKTLLIPEKFTRYSQDYFQQYYDGQVKIVGDKEILQSIKKKDGRYAYLMITINDISSDPSFNHIILDCVNNEPMLVYRNSNAYHKPMKGFNKAPPGDDNLDFLSSVHFKKYQKIINSR
jgi:hypothetical protein